MKILLLCFTLSVINCATGKKDKPNIVIIMADDLGWNDVSFHGSDEIPTPNIDALGYNGVILNRHYAHHMCTPSRAALMTGKFSIHTGMQHYAIASDTPWGLGVNETIMPQYFQQAGYRTHLVGKWHLGFHEKMFTPTLRGFDSHFGYLGPYIDYWDHKLVMLNRNYSRGLDMRNNLEFNYETSGTYATDLLTDEAIKIINNQTEKSSPMFLLLSHLSPHAANDDDPMQAPEEELNQFSHIENTQRRTLAAMISSLDKGIGRVVAALKENSMLENTIILFFSDNGAPTFGMHGNLGSNHPFRGQKNSPWEGAVRAVTTLWSSKLQRKQSVSNQLIHIADWLPTLLGAAGIEIENATQLDGINQWKSLTDNLPSNRVEIINTIDEIDGFSSILYNNWKLVNGSNGDGQYDGWLGSNNTTYRNPDYFAAVVSSVCNQAFAGLSPEAITEDKMKILREEATILCPSIKNPEPCNASIAPCLFDISQDPCELNDLSKTFPFKLKMMLDVLEQRRKTTLPSRVKDSDERASPRYFNDTWHWWLPDEMSPEEYAQIHSINLHLRYMGSEDEGNDKLDIKTVCLIIVSCLTVWLFIVNLFLCFNKPQK